MRADIFICMRSIGTLCGRTLNEEVNELFSSKRNNQQKSTHTHPSRQNDHTKTKTKTNVGQIFGILSM